jgi:hypothetical protein
MCQNGASVDCLLFSEPALSAMAESFKSRLPPRWKVEREIKRVGAQARRVGLRLTSDVMKVTHDMTKHKRIAFIAGDQPQRDDVAVFLVYQPNDLLASTFATLRHLNANGYSVQLVVNHPLDDAQLARLRPLTTEIMIRPNVGYDFGGYRDAILHLLDTRPPKGQLLVLNDSVWFPIWPDCDLLDRFRRAPEDVYGFIFNDDPPNRKPAHIQSYLFRFSPDALRLPAFKTFWKRIRVSSDRVMAIRRCEIPMTCKLRDIGLTHGAIYKSTDLAEQLRNADDELLKSVVRLQIALSEHRAPPLRDILSAAQAGAPTWRDDAIEQIEAHHAGRYLLMAHPDIVYGKMGIEVLKKNRGPRYILQRRLAMDRGIVSQFMPEVAAEIATWDTNAPDSERFLETKDVNGDRKIG